MKRFVWNWVAVSSLLFGALTAAAETRPQYGGTLHVSMRAAPLSLDPSDNSAPDSFGRRTLTSLVFDTLVSIDESGRAKPDLAESWQVTRGGQRWQFRLRRGVKLHDGTPLTAEIVAASLRFANPTWNVSADQDMVVIERDTSDPELLAELALPRNAIAKRESAILSGTGPFRIVDWQPGRKLTLAANEDDWRGRPFLDGIEIEMGKSFRDQMTALDLGEADLVEIAPEQTHRVSQERHQLLSSAPIDLLALVFTHDASSPEEMTLREALNLSIDRSSIRNVLLQGAGLPTGSLLPTWISGYGFVFPSDADLTKAHQLRAQVRTIPSWTLGYDGSDPLARLLAERIALNARDGGLSLQPTSSATADVRLLHIPIASSDGWVALDGIIAQAGLPATKTHEGSAEELYAVEQAALSTGRVIPLFHLPATYASGANLRNWTVRADGSVDLEDAWLESSRP